MANIRLEAESLTLENYKVETESFASSGALARITGDTGSIKTILGNGVAAGSYSLDIAYFDESDGQSNMELWVNGTRQDAWKFANSAGGTRASSANKVVRRVPVDIELKAGDTVELRGTLNEGEVARVDYIELIPISATTAPAPAPANQAPVAGNDSATTQADTPIVINVLSNDSDPDGDPINLSGVSEAASGTVSSNANGTLTYTPKAGFSGNDSFSYSISDGKGGSNTATVGVVVNAAPPTVDESNSSRTTSSASPASIVRIEAESMTLSGYEKESASFASGGQLIRIPNSGTSGTATAQFTGVAGTYDLKVVYHDESDGKSTLKITAGQGFATSFQFDENTSSTRAVADNRRERVFSGVQLDANATIKLEGFLNDGEVARVDYIELIPRGGTTPPPAPTNRAPIASNDSAVTTAGTPIAINVLSNDSDPDGDPINLSGVSEAANGTVSSNANGTLTYTPKAGFSGNDSFSYSISDGKGGSNTATVGVVVNAAPPTGGGSGSGSSGSPASVVRIEAESMTLSGYEKESASFASGGQLIRIPNSGTSGTATAQFTGVAGTYDLKVVYHDESDGKSTLKITAGQGFATSFQFDENTSSTRAVADNRRERVFSGVQLDANATIKLEGFLNDGEVARVDYIELIPKGGTTQIRVLAVVVLAVAAVRQITAALRVASF